MESKLIVVSKSDLAKYVGFDEEMYISDIKNINGKAKIIKTSSNDPESFKDVVNYIEHMREHLLGAEHSH